VLAVSGRKAGVSAVALTMLAVGVLLLMVMFAARSGPERIFAGPLHDPDIGPAHPTFSVHTLPKFKVNRHQHSIFHDNPFFTAVGWMIRLAILVCILWLAYQGAKRLAERIKDFRRRKAPARPEAVDFDVLDDPTPLVQEMQRDADEQFELLLGGEPRNAIVECWDRFEEQAERAKAARHDWETSSEFILRLLDAMSADHAAVVRLEGLYREARFSQHEIDEGRRESAVEALRAIHASLGIRAGVR
jgi:hypothetical protein